MSTFTAPNTSSEYAPVGVQAHNPAATRTNQHSALEHRVRTQFMQYTLGRLSSQLLIASSQLYASTAGLPEEVPWGIGDKWR